MTERAFHPDPGDSRGLTLVELMVVLVFMALGVLTLFAVQTRSFTDVHDTGRYTLALEVAESQMEAARGAGFALAASDSGTTGGIRWTRIVQNEDALLKRVTVSVAWNEGEAARSLRLVSLLASR